MAPAPLTDDEKRMQLQKTFNEVPIDKHNNQWDRAWQQELTPWDRRTHHPALEDTLLEKREILGLPLTADGRRRTAFVPGCGKGYDVCLLASFGYDAYGVDVSSTAVKAGEQVRAEQESLYPVRDAKVGRGSVKVLEFDFFAGDFSSIVKGGQFDIIFDYTFLCALFAPMRPKWSARMSQLLLPTGHLICVEFPLDKPLHAPGPPHGLSEELYQELLSHPGKEVEYEQETRIVIPDRKAEASSDGLTRVARWQPTRTHPNQNSRVSVWRH